MFCIHCGSELPDGSKWCPQCGTEIKPAVATSSGSAKPAVFDRTKNLFKGEFLAPKEAIEALGKSEQAKAKKLLLIAGLLQFVLLILFYCSFGVAKASYSVLGIEESKNYSYTFRGLFEGVGFLRFLVFVCQLGSASLCILPILQNKAVNKRLLLVSKIIAILHVALELLCMIALSETAKDAADRVSGLGELVDLKVSWYLSFGGWLNVILSVAVAVLLFYVSVNIKKKQED